MNCAALLLAARLAVGASYLPEPARSSGVEWTEARVALRKVVSQINRLAETPNAAGSSETRMRLQSLMIEARRRVAPEATALALNCLPAFAGGQPTLQCRLLDRSRPHARVVSAPDAADLPLTVGEALRCSFTVLPDGRLLTADHCGPDAITRGSIFTSGGPRAISANFEAALRVEASHVTTGRAFEDLSVWRPLGEGRGRPMYILVVDRGRTEGCEILDGQYLACAPRTLAELHGRRAHVLGYPQVRYPNRERAETVLKASGDLYYDPEGHRFLIHAAVSWGASGGPAYLDAGLTLGGVTINRPLYLGPLSGFAPPNPRPLIFDTETVAIVGVYDLARVRSVLATRR